MEMVCMKNGYPFRFAAEAAEIFVADVEREAKELKQINLKISHSGESRREPEMVPERVPDLCCAHGSSDLETTSRQGVKSTSSGCAGSASYPHLPDALNHADEAFTPPRTPTSTPPTITTPPTSPGSAFTERPTQQDSEPRAESHPGIGNNSFPATPHKRRPRTTALNLEPVQEKDIILDSMQKKTKRGMGPQKSKKPKDSRPRSNAVPAQVTSQGVVDALSTVMGLAAPAMDRLEVYYRYNPLDPNDLQPNTNNPISVSSSHFR
jgi:hypothetical protein